MSAGLTEVLIAASQKLAVDMAEWAKKNASWTDRTGYLRKYIEPYTHVEDDAVIAGIGERMEYGEYIEKNPKYGIIKPTLDHFLPDAKRLFGDSLRAYTIAQMKEAAGHDT